MPVHKPLATLNENQPCRSSTLLFDFRSREIRVNVTEVEQTNGSRRVSLPKTARRRKVYSVSLESTGLNWVL